MVLRGVDRVGGFMGCKIAGRFLEGFGRDGLLGVLAGEAGVFAVAGQGTGSRRATAPAPGTAGQAADDIRRSDGDQKKRYDYL